MSTTTLDPRHEISEAIALRAARPFASIRRWVVEAVQASPLTFGIIAAMVVVWGIEQALFGQQHGSRKIGYLAFGALPNADVIRRGSPAELWRFVASGLLHDRTSPFHLLVNSIALAMVGSVIERVYGRLVMLGTLVLGVVVGGGTWMAASALGLAPIPDYTIGLSAGICALVGLLLVYGYREAATLGSAQALSMRTQATLGIALMVLIGLTVPNLNNFAHAGGLVCGGIIALLLPVHDREGRLSLGWRTRMVLASTGVLAAVSLALAAVNLVGRLTSTS